MVQLSLIFHAQRQLLNIFENNAIFDRYRNKLNKNEDIYYHVLFVWVPSVIIMTVAIKNKVKIKFEIQIKMVEIEITIQFSNQL